MADADVRPEPEALLAEAEREGRGRLKIFLGAAPGVGKTYAMLEAAREPAGRGRGRRGRRGRDPWPRRDRAAPAGLEILPRQPPVLPRPGAAGDGSRRAARPPPGSRWSTSSPIPTSPGSRHAKRWQDVEELLAAGIDVYTTLNIQHLESLNDVVARITGVRVRETVPDAVLERADEIELIDLPPEELIARLRQGKVYVQEQIARAIQNFFSKGNLTALRELAMRVAADRVDAQMRAHMRAHAIPGPWPAQERILVCINEAPVVEERGAGRQAHGRPGAPALDRAERRDTHDRGAAGEGEGPPRRDAAARRDARRRGGDARRQLRCRGRDPRLCALAQRQPHSDRPAAPAPLGRRASFARRSPRRC